MLSINIPVYNYNVVDLVYLLNFEAEKLGIQFEIRVYDDGSESKIRLENQKILKYQHVVYLELEKNLGRAAIRNKMGFDSKFEYLLFIDADSMPVNEYYLENFIKEIKPSRILCGGTTYRIQKPLQKEKFLRWMYGINREAVPAESRNKLKGFIITSNNFLIEKSVFARIHFREELRRYGHEDTLLGYDLFRNGIEIRHIDNPVEHTGLEDSQIFLEKTRTAVQSLYDIAHDLLPGDTAFMQQVRFLRHYKKLTKYIPPFFLRFFYKISRNFIEKELNGEHPSLFLFDFYKIGYYSTLK